MNVIAQNDSILLTIKRMLGLDEDCDDFDVDVIVNINSAILSLSQIGVVSDHPIAIVDQNQTWSELLGESSDFEAAKMYIHLKVLLGFDPPTNSFVIASMEKQISELEWRLMVQAEKEVQNDFGSG